MTCSLVPSNRLVWFQKERAWELLRSGKLEEILTVRNQPDPSDRVFATLYHKTLSYPLY